MKSIQNVPARQAHWALQIAMEDMRPGEVLRLEGEGREFLSVVLNESGWIARLTTCIGENPRFAGREFLNFELTSRSAAPEISVEWLNSSARLVVSGDLADEEWPIGTLPEGPWAVHCAQSVKSHAFTQPNADLAERETRFTGPMQYFMPPGHNTGTGDCMPFARDGRYCLYYLFDRRGHRSKGGLGAHQWAQISSNDLKTWTIHPMAVPVTEQWEGSICTGSLIQKDGKTYAFYAARTSDGSPALLTWAESEDGVHFTKSKKTFALTDPYEPVSARDPMVFLGDDGLFHMLVTTSIVSMERYGGCLAHLTSENLIDWTQHEPLIVPGYADQPECSDYFEWNGWYYLVFSNFATARYRMSRSPLGPWTRPAYDVLDTTENQVVKTASFKERRLMTGFLASYPRTYAGYAVTHELFQREDGTLGVKFAEEILPESCAVVGGFSGELDGGAGRVEESLCETLPGLRAKLTLRPANPSTLYGLCLRIGEKEYRVDMDPAARKVSVLRPNQYFSMGDARNQVCCVDLSGDVDMDLIVYGDVLDMTFADGRAHLMRLGDDAKDGCTLSVYAQSGAVNVVKAEIYRFKEAQS